ncbi:hypothetical protein GCM10009554_04970 [Kribbella koreensis]|uniref:FAD-dependent oxidoreductase 2 FAD-binding domain-containing protein n=1 Tax=Kribbella koreensis TaxID=57909 RepID=A0ABN1PAZ8_9ACTN
MPYAYDAPPYRLPGQIAEAQAATRYMYPLGVMVNRNGQRFVDERSAVGNLTYAKLGRSILEQPGKWALQVFAGNEIGKLHEGYRKDSTVVHGDSLEDLEASFGLPRYSLTRAFADAIQESASLKHWGLSYGSTMPPFLGLKVACGLTFTFGGLQVDRQANILDEDGQKIPGLFAAGEAVGGIFSENYPGGAGLLAGTVLGLRAGFGCNTVL